MLHHFRLNLHNSHIGKNTPQKWELCNFLYKICNTLLVFDAQLCEEFYPVFSQLRTWYQAQKLLSKKS